MDAERESPTSSTGAGGIRTLRDRVLRKVAPRSAVSRHVQGVDLVLPRLHLLPDYTSACPAYGQNLVHLGEGVAAGGPFTMIDVGANVGDSALQVLRAAPVARVVCVEGDPAWLPWLERNVGTDSRIVVVPALLSPDPEQSTDMVAVRGAGTTRFVPGDERDSVAPVAVDSLAAHHAELPAVRLIKSDTDGHDTRLIPALATAYLDDRPVLFFEYDERLSQIAGDDRPDAVVPLLADLGYEHFAAWDNKGEPVGRFSAGEWSTARGTMVEALRAGHYDFWDLSAAHVADQEGQQVLARLVPERILP